MNPDEQQPLPSLRCSRGIPPRCAPRLGIGRFHQDSQAVDPSRHGFNELPTHKETSGRPKFP